MAPSVNGCFSRVSSSDLAPGNDEIYEEKQENFLTAGNPQDGQVVLYKVGRGEGGGGGWWRRAGGAGGGVPKL